MRSEIVLIGPFGAGKSTVGDLLAERLGIPNVSMDSHKHWYKELGFSNDEFNRLWSEASPHTADRYFRTFFPASIERLFSEYSNCVFDLGAGHVVFEDDALFQRVKKTLEPFSNIVLILPSPDLDESVRILREREGQRKANPYFLSSTEFDYFSHWVKSHCNLDLAKYTVYTEGKTPGQTRDEVLQLIARGKRADGTPMIGLKRS